MTAQQINNKAKQLHNKVVALDKLDNDTYFEVLEKEIKPLFLEIYNSNKTFELMNKQSVLIMLVLNNRFRIIPFHMFGININL